MKKITAFVFLLFSFQNIMIAQSWNWSRTSSPPSSIDFGSAIVIDSSGLLYVAGFDMVSGLIHKFDQDGTHVNSGIVSNVDLKSVNYADSGFLYVCGHSSSSAIAKTDLNLNVIWKSQKITGTINSITSYKSNHIYATGDRYLLARLYPNGDTAWVIRDSNVYGNSVCLDDSGFIYVTGRFQGICSFGNTTLSAQGNSDIFIARFDSTGSCKWVRSSGGSRITSYSRDQGLSIKVNRTFEIYVTGSFIDSLVVDSVVLTSGYNLANNIFLLKLNSNGKAIWGQKAEGYSDEEGRCLEFDQSDNVLVGGSYVPTISFNGNSLTGWGNYDAFIATYDNQGNFIRATKAGGRSWNESVNGIVTTSDGSIFTTGSYTNEAYFGKDTLRGRHYFIARLENITSIKELEHNVKVYPNPASDHLNIESGQELIDEILLFNVSGVTFFGQDNINTRFYTIYNIPVGIYICKITLNTGVVLYSKIVVA